MEEAVLFFYYVRSDEGKVTDDVGSVSQKVQEPLDSKLSLGAITWYAYLSCRKRPM